jgi:hypothetical protein
MTTPIPDQFRQWYAQFSAGDVPFTRILSEIDIAIASFTDLHTPDHVVALAQHWALWHALYDCWHTHALPEYRLMAGLEDWRAAYALACREQDTRIQLETLLDIYRVNPQSADLVLPACYALINDAPQMDQDNTFFLVSIPNKRDQGAYTDLMIAQLITHGEYETALQMAGRLSQEQFDQRLTLLIRYHLARGDLQQAWRCCFLISQPDNFAHMRAKIHCTHIMMLVHTGQVSEAQLRLDRALAEINSLSHPRLRTTLTTLLLPCCAALHRWQKAAHLHHVATRNKEETIAQTWEQWRQWLLYEADPQRLMGFYYQLTQKVYSYGIRLAVLERLAALGYTAFARQKLRLHTQMPSLTELALPLLDTLGEHDLVNSYLERLIAEANQRLHDINRHLMRVAQHFVRLRRYDQLEPLLALRPVSANELFDIIEQFIEQEAAAQNWAEVVRLVNEWTQPEKVYRPAYWHWIPRQLRLLCRAAIQVYRVDPAQTQAWLQTAEDFLLDASVSPDNTQEQYDLLLEAYLATDNNQAIHTSAKKLLVTLSVETAVKKFYQLAETGMPHQPNHARLFLRLARQQRPHQLKHTVSNTLLNLTNRQLPRNPGAPIPNIIEQVVASWSKDRVALEGFGKNLLVWRTGAHPGETDLPERVIEACIAVLFYLAESAAQDEATGE